MKTVKLLLVGGLCLSMFSAFADNASYLPPPPWQPATNTSSPWATATEEASQGGRFYNNPWQQPSASSSRHDSYSAPRYQTPSGNAPYFNSHNEHYQAPRQNDYLRREFSEPQNIWPEATRQNQWEPYSPPGSAHNQQDYWRNRSSQTPPGQAPAYQNMAPATERYLQQYQRGRWNLGEGKAATPYPSQGSLYPSYAQPPQSQQWPPPQRNDYAPQQAPSWNDYGAVSQPPSRQQALAEPRWPPAQAPSGFHAPAMAPHYRQEPEPQSYQTAPPQIPYTPPASGFSEYMQGGGFLLDPEHPEQLTPATAPPPQIPESASPSPSGFAESPSPATNPLSPFPEKVAAPSPGTAPQNEILEVLEPMPAAPLAETNPLSSAGTVAPPSAPLPSERPSPMQETILEVLEPPSRSETELDSNDAREGAPHVD